MTWHEYRRLYLRLIQGSILGLVVAILIIIHF